jgi:hypothetical protein
MSVPTCMLCVEHRENELARQISVANAVTGRHVHVGMW